MSERRILIIDDDDDIREVARASLEVVGGWDVSTAASGREGIAKAAAERPDAILLDVMMPDIDGLATFQKLRSDSKTNDIPVVFLTAKVQPADRRQLNSLGGRATIAKPFDPLTLASEVARALGWPS